MQTPGSSAKGGWELLCLGHGRKLGRRRRGRPATLGVMGRGTRGVDKASQSSSPLKYLLPWSPVTFRPIIVIRYDPLSSLQPCGPAPPQTTATAGASGTPALLPLCAGLLWLTCLPPLAFAANQGLVSGPPFFALSLPLCSALAAH